MGMGRQRETMNYFSQDSRKALSAQHILDLTDLLEEGVPCVAELDGNVRKTT
jgi:hypothetical protein